MVQKHEELLNFFWQEWNSIKTTMWQNYPLIRMTIIENVEKSI